MNAKFTLTCSCTAEVRNGLAIEDLTEEDLAADPPRSSDACVMLSFWDEGDPPDSLLCKIPLMQSEARAIASALMGAAAELK